jgi:F-type H+-transporting ATPase subunit gamma
VAGGQERELRRRIRSIQSTKKITRAMELIAASRIVRAQQAIKAARPYVGKMREVVEHLADTPDATTHPLFRQPDEVRNVALIVMAGDRGLSGAYNSSVLRQAERLIAAHEAAGRRVIVVAAGRKVEGYFRYRNRPLAEAVTGMTDRPGFGDAQRIVAAVMAPFAEGQLDQVELVFTRFASMSSQAVETRQLVPTASPEPKDPAATAVTGYGADGTAAVTHSIVDYDYEPDPAEILDALLPRWLEAEIYVALLESSASEYAARQRAMKAATDNAEELTKTLSRIMNRARQDAITTEIMEIVGGAEAQRADAGDGAGNFREIYLPPEAESA